MKKIYSFIPALIFSTGIILFISNMYAPYDSCGIGVYTCCVSAGSAENSALCTGRDQIPWIGSRQLLHLEGRGR